LGALDAWRASKRTFDEAVALEMHDAGRRYLDTYLTKLNRLAKGDFKVVTDSPLSSMVVEQMMHWLPEQQPLLARLRRCAEFFQSQHFANVPNEWISSHMFATLKEMLKRGALSNPGNARKTLTGALDDIKHISLYAPYCDAIVVDNFMADLVSRPSVNLEERYGVKVFSLSSWDKLLAWLEDLVGSMSAEHSRGVDAAYPESR
jgi:inhibitor of KinA sporulation pathway (predicted exonuclease)